MYFGSGDDVVTFGKYKGKTFEQAYSTQPDYFVWWRDERMKQGHKPTEIMSLELHKLLDDQIAENSYLKKKGYKPVIGGEAAMKELGEAVREAKREAEAAAVSGYKSATKGIAKGAAARAMAALKVDSEPAPWSEAVPAKPVPAAHQDRYADWGGF